MPYFSGLYGKSGKIKIKIEKNVKKLLTDAGIDGIIVTKLDGTAKGGALFSISNRLELPIFYVGIGEKQDDLIEFSPDDFVDSLLDEIFTPDEK